MTHDPNQNMLLPALTAPNDKANSIGPGTLFAGYRILSVLGAGGSGTVYRATRSNPRQVVALKVMNVEHVGDDSERQRFAREAELVKRLAHPHVVGLLDYGFERELPYLVFPFLEGRTLDTRIASEGSLGWDLVGRFSEQALSALEMAHGMGIAHRDIKPANLFCSRNRGSDNIQILDFGTAKIVGERTQYNEVTRAGVLVGTPRYMAPEQVRSEPLTPAADVYAFGLVMTEMLTGRRLITGSSDFEIYVAQGSDEPHELPDEVLASPFGAVIARAVAKPIDVRYRLASQMLADLRAVLSRVSQGELKPSEADLEATSYLGLSSAPIVESEVSLKLRQAFNTIASRSSHVSTAPPASVIAAEPPPVVSSPSAAPESVGPRALDLEHRVSSHALLARRRSERVVPLLLVVLLILASAVAVTTYLMKRHA